MSRRFVLSPLVALSLCAGSAAPANSDQQPIDLVVDAGTPLRVALDQRVRVKHVGQAVTATVVEPVYAFDRIVVPSGARVVGHLERLEGPSTGTRLRAMLGGNLSPPRKVVLNFNALVLPDGEAYPIHSLVTSGAENVTLQVAGASEATGVVARVRREIAQEARQAITTVQQPGKMRRLTRWLRDTAIGALPMHPQFIPEDTVYSVKLLAPLSFGSVTPAELAPPDVGRRRQAY